MMAEDGFTSKGELLEDQLKPEQPKKRGRKPGYRRTPEEIAKMLETKKKNKELGIKGKNIS